MFVTLAFWATGLRKYLLFTQASQGILDVSPFLRVVDFPCVLSWPSDHQTLFFLTLKLGIHDANGHHHSWRQRSWNFSTCENHLKSFGHFCFGALPLRFNRSESGIREYAYFWPTQGPQFEKYLSTLNCPPTSSTYQGLSRDSPAPPEASYEWGEEILQRPISLK